MYKRSGLLVPFRETPLLNGLRSILTSKLLTFTSESGQVYFDTVASPSCKKTVALQRVERDGMGRRPTSLIRALYARCRWSDVATREDV